MVDGLADPNAGGGSIAAPVFAELTAYALQQLRISPLSDGEVPDRVRATAAGPMVPAEEDGASETADHASP